MPAHFLPPSTFLRRLAFGACALLLALGAQAQGVQLAGRWDSAMADFAKSDEAQRPGEGGVLFVGSSSIRLWQRLPQDFSNVPVLINRGFGGSTMADCRQLVRQLVLQYKPRHVLVYAGENDLAEGRSPAEVLDSFRGFVQVVREELPDVRIDYISIKPSPLRAQLLPQVREANRLLAAYVGELENAGFVDVFSSMVDDSGAPRADLFGPDRLHMNDTGYALWRQLLAQRVSAPQVRASQASQAHVPAALPAPTGGAASAAASR